jgi:hypothetical protein
MSFCDNPTNGTLSGTGIKLQPGLTSDSNGTRDCFVPRNDETTRGRSQFIKDLTTETQSSQSRMVLT